MNLPLCKYGDSNCVEVSYLVKSTQENKLEDDIFVCGRCANTLFAGTKPIEIPKPDDVLEPLQCVEYIVDEIMYFCKVNHLDKLWSWMKPDLEEYQERCIQMVNEMGSAKIGKASKFAKGKRTFTQWRRLPYIDIEARRLLDSLFDSNIMTEYTRRAEIKKFRDHKYGTNKLASIPKIVDAQMIVKLRNHIVNTRYGEAQAKLREKSAIIKNLTEVKALLTSQNKDKDQEIQELKIDNQSKDKEISKMKERLEKYEKKIKKLEEHVDLQSNKIEEIKEEAKAQINSIDQPELVDNSYKSSKGETKHCEKTFSRYF
ncbi:unnamed protein product [Moneuplotes crassus]|uniref:Uncharacterized protein n=1 Tax=Euplotes crassus TaxID=5936 RepID=A0AAD1UA07_EUPCR|nr:unnamed protein product [Moneuplotes crassus]